MVNKGSAGADGLKTTQLAEYFREHKSALLEDIKNDRYLPLPILGVEIPKGGGKFRFLGIPTVVDRMLQLAVSQAMMLRFEKDFSVNSFGFRLNKNARQAVDKAVYSIVCCFFNSIQFNQCLCNYILFL